MDPEDLLSSGSLLPLTAAEHVGLINSIPTTFGQVNADGLFPERGLSTPYVRIDILDGVITALPVTDKGRPSSIARHGRGKGVVFEIPNISHEDSVLAHDLREWLAFAQRSNTPDEAIVNRIEERHRQNRLKFDITLEVLKLSALKGVIVDGAGDELYNLWDVFDVTQRVVYFDFANSSADIPAAIEAVIGGTEDALINDVMTGVEARVSPEFYNKLIRHASIEKYFANTPAMYDMLLQQQRQNVAGAFRRTITIAGLTFKEYRAKVKLWGADATSRLIQATEGFANPIGTQDAHATYVAPPLDVRELNGSAASVGDLIHLTEEPMKHGGGLEWKYQANPLPLWKKPSLLTKLVAGADPG